MGRRLQSKHSRDSICCPCCVVGHAEDAAGIEVLGGRGGRGEREDWWGTTRTSTWFMMRWA